MCTVSAYGNARASRMTQFVHGLEKFENIFAAPIYERDTLSLAIPGQKITIGPEPIE